MVLMDFVGNGRLLVSNWREIKGIKTMSVLLASVLSEVDPYGAIFEHCWSLNNLQT